MPTSTLSNVTEPSPSHTHARGPAAEPNFDTPAKSIAEFTARPDFPKCTLDAHVDIGGYTGVVVDIVLNSIKVRSREGTTQSFNFHRLRTLYAHRPEHIETAQPENDPLQTGHSENSDSPVPQSRRDVIAEPDFKSAVKPIAHLVQQIDFPKCALGAHVDFGGFTGVVVEILNQSLKVRAATGELRSYNAAGLRKIHGRPG